MDTESRGPPAAPNSAAARLEMARQEERAGNVAAAEPADESPCALAEAAGDRATLSMGLRHLALLHHQRGASARAGDFGRRAYDVALAAGERELAAHALNVRAAFALQAGDLPGARRIFDSALGSRAAAPHSARASNRTSGSSRRSRGTTSARWPTTLGASRATSPWVTSAALRSPTTISA
jgi:hypothetical protein